MKNILKFSIISVIFVSLFSLMVYGVSQQMLRLGANDVPLKLSVDAINELKAGIPAKSLRLPEKVEISQSLSPWLIILDQNKKVLATSATLDGTVPTIPQGIFDWVAQSGQDRVTWQPRVGVREAIVIDKYSFGNTSGFVVSGISLKEVESRIDKIGFDVLVGWAVINLFTITSLIFLEMTKK